MAAVDPETSSPAREDKDTISETREVKDENDMTEGESGAQQGGSGDNIDPYAYLKRDEFTSEIYKIEINNLPKRFGVGQLRKKLVSMGLKPGKIKFLQNGYFAFVNFKCEEDREDAMKKIEGHPWKGKNLKVKKAQPAADPLLKKRKLDAAAEGEPKSKEAKNEAPPENMDIPIEDRLNNAVSPLWKQPYEHQLVEKARTLRSFLKKLAREIDNNNLDVDYRDDMRAMYRQHKGMCCEVLPVKPSPVLNGYRNKCELTIGQSPDGVDKVVGFRLGRYKGGSVSVVQTDACVILPDRMKQCAKSLQQFLQTKSSRPGFDPETKQGNWKMALLRTNQVLDTLMAVVFHPQQLSKEEVATERENLQEYFTVGEGRDTPIKSLYFLVQSDRHTQGEELNYEHLHGDKYLEEDLLGVKFRISPAAFFQVNTLGAEVLYSTIGDWCSLSPNSVVLDICCGTGSIGLTLAKRVKKVVGIELCKEAVEDAKTNAKLNGVDNAEYFCGKAESILPSLIWRYAKEEDVVAVVDPPRAGLHRDVVRAIRKSEFVNRLVFVACKPNASKPNITDLTRSESKRVHGPPFRLTQATAVDLFPHTPEIEVLMLLERPRKEKPKPAGGESQPGKPSTDSSSQCADNSHELPVDVKQVQTGESQSDLPTNTDGASNDISDD